MPNKKKIAFFTSLATTIVGLVIVGSILLIWDIFNQTEKRVVFVLLSDAFFISGFMIFGIGALIMIASTGFFDILSYGFKSIWYLFIKITYKKGELEKYYEYVERKRELRERKKDKAFSFYVVLVGLVFIGIAAIFLLLTL